MLAKYALALLATLMLALVLATPSQAYLHVDWGCVQGMSYGNNSSTGWWFGKYGWGGIVDNRNFGGNALSQALIMTADDQASRWNSWPGYSRGASALGNHIRYGNEDLMCEIVHQSIFGNYNIWNVRVKGYDDGLHGVVTSMRVVRERDYNTNLQKFKDVATNWDACANDSAC